MSQDFTEAVKLLQDGELVAFPTETVYGLGADAANPEAVARIFAAKGRPADHPLIVHLPGAGYLDRWARDIPPVAWELAEAFWPGPLTLILKRASAVPYAVTGGQETVGVRVPAHPLALGLLRAYAQAGGGANHMGGIAAPSANRFGRISPTDAAHVREELGDAVALVLDGGPCAVGIESTILDLSRDDQPPRLLRPGHITPEQIETVIGVMPELPSSMQRRNDDAAPRVSGSLDAHYAPLTPMRVVSSRDVSAVLQAYANQGVSFGLLAYGRPPALVQAHALRCLPADPEGYARGLYAALRELDQAGNEVIVVEAIPTGPAWAAVADRMRRAECGSGAV
ncbi:MAG: L-threonylcarbamoyladenylate synthase [Propionivibrio sp.]